MRIQKIQPSELNSLLQLYQLLHVKDDPLPDDGIIQETWNQIQENTSHLIFGTFVKDKLVSSCVLNIIQNLTRGCRPYALIENMVTHPDFRRCGYGKSLIEYSVNYAKSKGCYKVMLMTGRKEESVYRFYESAGFNRHDKQAFVLKFDRTP